MSEDVSKTCSPNFDQLIGITLKNYAAGMVANILLDPINLTWSRLKYVYCDFCDINLNKDNSDCSNHEVQRLAKQGC